MVDTSSPRLMSTRTYVLASPVAGPGADAAAAVPPPPPSLLLLLLLLLCRYSLLRAFHTTQNEKQSVETWLCSAIHRGSRSSSSTAAAQKQHSSSTAAAAAAAAEAAARQQQRPAPLRSLGLAVVLCLRCRACVCSFCVYRCILVVSRCPGCAVSASG